jgi:hypothetical protein
MLQLNILGIGFASMMDGVGGSGGGGGAGVTNVFKNRVYRRLYPDITFLASKSYAI